MNREDIITKYKGLGYKLTKDVNVAGSDYQLVMIKDDIRTGFNFYNPNETLCNLEERFEDGRLHGVAMLFHINGKPSRIQRFQNGLFHGDSETLNEAGDVTHSEYYEVGERVSKKLRQEIEELRAKLAEATK